MIRQSTDGIWVSNSPELRGLGLRRLGPVFPVQFAVEAAVADACSFVGADSHIRCAEPGGVSGVVVLLRLRVALRSHPRPVVLDLAICRGVVPSQDGGDQAGHWRGRGEAAVPGLDRDPSATRQESGTLPMGRVAASTVSLAITR